MSRTYTADSLVALPRMSALSAARLIQELLGAAKAEKKLPAAIAVDQQDLDDAYTALHAELAKRITAEGDMPPVVRAADLVEDNIFGAIHGLLSAWARLPVDKYPLAAEAARAKQTLFPDGLSFITIRPEDEWQEAELRIHLIADKGFDALLIKLGGEPFLLELASAHKAYGEALGITTPKAQAESPALREAKGAAVEVLRDYVLRVSAHVRKKDPTTGELAARLLAPLTNWRDRPTQAASDIDAPTPVVTPPVAPTP